jgi:hypothetical protein
MRRIYESRALQYDDEDPYAPKRRDDGDSDPGPRTIDWSAASHVLVPTWLRRRAVTVTVETDRDSYAPDEPVGFRVRFRNRLPFPVAVPTASPVPWTWSIDGVDEASHVATLPEERGLFEFDRAERKQFTRRWQQRFQRDGRTWTPADRGEHTLAARINTPSGVESVTAETTFRIE